MLVLSKRNTGIDIPLRDSFCSFLLNDENLKIEIYFIKLLANTTLVLSTSRMECLFDLVYTSQEPGMETVTTTADCVPQCPLTGRAVMRLSLAHGVNFPTLC